MYRVSSSELNYALYDYSFLLRNTKSNYSCLNLAYAVAALKKDMQLLNVDVKYQVPIVSVAFM